MVHHLALWTEHELPNDRVLSVRADDYVDLPRGAVLEHDVHAAIMLRVDGPHRITERDFGVIADRAKQDAHEVVSHDLDFTIAAGFAHRPQGDVVRAPAIGPHT